MGSRSGGCGEAGGPPLGVRPTLSEKGQREAGPGQGLSASGSPPTRTRASCSPTLLSPGFAARTPALQDLTVRPPPRLSQRLVRLRLGSIVSI